MTNIFEILIFIGFYFLKTPFATLFDHINNINDKEEAIN